MNLSFIFLGFLCLLGTFASVYGFSIQSIDLNQHQNHQNHRTNQYQNPYLIIRRGQEFQFQVRFDRQYALQPQIMQCQLKLIENRKTIVNLGTNTRHGYIRVKQYQRGIATVVASFNSESIIGKYQASFSVQVRGQKAHQSFSMPLVVLFNPYNSKDSVYMSNSNQRREYIENERGILYRSGSKWSGFGPSAWNFDQFDSQVFDATLYLLHRIPSSHRGSSIWVSRLFSALANVNDENGVLVGKWSGSYDDGTAPWGWTGSQRILSQYLRTKRPVKYGQCWVFAAVLTTMLRSVGIPSRPVSNFVSGHDTDYNRAIDEYYDRNMKKMEDYTRDSVWNFHVWTEAWMLRSDLSQGRDGWQAVDATPQERSNGIFQMGPSSVISVRQLENRKYDNEFVISEVAASLKVHQQQSNGRFKLIRTQQNYVGKNLVTKAVGSNNYNLITSTYKRARESGGVNSLDLMYNIIDGDVHFSGNAIKQTIGQPISVRLNGAHRSTTSRTIDYHVVFSSRSYNGKSKTILETIEFSKTYEASFNEEFILSVEKYQNYLVNSGNWFQCEIHAIVQGTKQVFHAQINMDLSLPEEIKISSASNEAYKVNSEKEVLVKFKNPFNNRSLTGGVLQIESSSRFFDHQQITVNNLEPNQRIEIPVKLTPKALGEAYVNYEFDFEEIKDLQTFETIQVV